MIEVRRKGEWRRVEAEESRSEGKQKRVERE